MTDKKADKFKKTPEKIASLDPFTREIIQKGATERPFTGKYLENKEAGLYVDIVTGEPLFASVHKYDSGSGWPSFTQPVDASYIVEKQDLTHGMIRVEVKSRHGDSHLGHLFPDGPVAAGGMRYCINSASLRFVPLAEMEAGGYGEYLGIFQD